MKTFLIFCVLLLSIGYASSQIPNPQPYELIVIDDRVVFDKAENISMQMVIRDLGVTKMIALNLYRGLFVVWDGKVYGRDPKHIGAWNGPWEVIPTKTAWRTSFSLSEYLVPSEALTAGRHTIALKDALSESNILTVFIEAKNR